MDEETDSSLRRAIEAFGVKHGYGADGGASKRWVRVVFTPLPLAIWMPNFDARRRALTLHDAHHLLTGYGTDLAGEAEISAWEIGGSCGDYWAAWLFDLLALAYGWWTMPRRTWRAFVRGRHTRNLYCDASAAHQLDMRIEQVREGLGLDDPVPSATIADRMCYVVWILVTLAPMALVALVVTGFVGAFVL